MTTAAPKRPILVVDDEPEMLYSLKRLLRQEYEVFTAGSAAEGLKILQNEVIHLVMTDQRMPEVTGVQFLRQIKNEHPAAMRLIFTGHADITAVIDAINQGNVFRYVTKPWDPEDLLAALREAGQRYDHLVQRNKLLNDLRAYEARCVEFYSSLVSGSRGSLTPDGTGEASQLGQSGKELLARVDKTLAAALNEPSR